MIEVKLKRLRDNAALPQYQTAGAAAMDLAAAIDAPMLVRPHTPVLVPTGIAIELPGKEYVALLFARSGLACKYGITLSNGVGVIDADYRGEILVGLTNLSETEYTIQPGQRIAQMMLVLNERCVWRVVDTLEMSERGEKGHGSTGTM